MTVTPGESVPELTRELGAAVLMAYGAATWDWHRLHYDQRYVEARGVDAPVVDGQMVGALCAQAVVDWLGPRAFVTKLGYKMGSIVFAGDTVLLLVQDGTVQPTPDEKSASGYRYTTVQIHKCDAEHTGILARGGREGEVPRTIGTTTRFSFVRDPDGNWLEVSQRAQLTGTLEQRDWKEKMRSR